jgi:HlyD family secretion protein
VVKSPYRGRVLELLVDAGALVQAGQSLISVDLPDQELDCYLFVPLAGKRIQPGMQTRVIPAGVAWEEYGYIVATVRSVSEAPVSPAAMDLFLHNETLTRQFSAQGGAYLVQVDLAEDAATPSGFKWTSRSGPPLRFGSGSLVTASVTVRDQAPITLVIPTLRRWIGF